MGEEWEKEEEGEEGKQWGEEMYCCGDVMSGSEI